MTRFQILVLLLIAIFLGGCDLLGLNPIPGLGGGNSLWLDDKGHLQADATYDSGNFFQVFRSNGTYERKWFHYDSTALKNLQYSGDSGTYSYDSTALKLTLQLTKYFDTSSATMLPYQTGVTHSFVATVLLLDHSSPFVYMKDGNGWLGQETYTYTDSVTPINNRTDTYTYSKTYAAKKGGYTYHYRQIVSKSGKASYVSEVSDIVGDIKVFPVGATLSAGSTVTFNIDETSDTYQLWNTTTGALGPVQNSGLGYYQHSVYCKDLKYIIYLPSDATRHVTRQSIELDDSIPTPPSTHAVPKL